MFDKAAADKAVTFIEHYCTHVKGEWQGDPLILEDWQKDEIIRPLFGTKKNGLRQYKTLYCEIPRKNAKTTLAGAIGLYLLLADGEGGAEIYSAAGDKEQANISFEIASRMVEQNKSLSQRVEILKKALFVQATNSTFKSLTSESRTKHGLNAHGILIDELHIHKNRELYDTLDNSTGSRRQPLTIIITTAGIREKGNIGWEMHEYARKVKEGTIKDPTFLCVIYGADEEDDPLSEETHIKANPNYGISCKKDYIKRKAARAKNEPTYLNSFLRFHLNIWTSSEQSFITGDIWDGCNLGELKEEDFYGKDVMIALDLSSKRDITALGMIKESEDGYDFLPFFWIPQETVNSRNLRDQFFAWKREGYVYFTEGNVVDYNFIRAKIDEISSKCNVVEISFDPWNSTKLVNDLQEDGANVLEMRQGYVTMSPAVKELEQLILNKKLNHGGNPVLKWMNSNVTVKEDPAGNVKFDKSKSSEKIDGMIVLAMCVSRAIFGEWGDQGQSIYETQEVVL